MLYHVKQRLLAARAQTKTSYSLFNKLASSIFYNKLRTNEAENPYKLRIASTTQNL